MHNTYLYHILRYFYTQSEYEMLKSSGIIMEGIFVLASSGLSSRELIYMGTYLSIGFIPGILCYQNAQIENTLLEV